jgi:hypothetical protein
MTVSSRPARCGRCGASYPASAFAELRAVGCLARGELAGIVVDWPPNVVVDVRACAACTAPIARLFRAPA